MRLALHVAQAVFAGVEYVSTQFCRYIANAHELPRISNCTPAEFLGDPNEDN